MLLVDAYLERQCFFVRMVTQGYHFWVLLRYTKIYFSVKDSLRYLLLRRLDQKKPIAEGGRRARARTEHDNTPINSRGSDRTQNTTMHVTEQRRGGEGGLGNTG